MFRARTDSNVAGRFDVSRLFDLREQPSRRRHQLTRVVVLVVVRQFCGAFRRCAVDTNPYFSTDTLPGESPRDFQALHGAAKDLRAAPPILGLGQEAQSSCGFVQLVRGCVSLILAQPADADSNDSKERDAERYDEPRHGLNSSSAAWLIHKDEARGS